MDKDKMDVDFMFQTNLELHSPSSNSIFSPSLKPKSRTIDFSLKLLEFNLNPIDANLSSTYKTPKAISKRHKVGKHLHADSKKKPLERILHNPILEPLAKKHIGNRTILKISIPMPIVARTVDSYLKHSKNPISTMNDLKYAIALDIYHLSN